MLNYSERKVDVHGEHSENMPSGCRRGRCLTPGILEDQFFDREGREDGPQTLLCSKKTPLYHVILFTFREM